MTSRFTDNPLRDPNMDPETAARLDARNAAYRHWHETGDPTEINKFGFNLPDRRAQAEELEPVVYMVVDETTTVEQLISGHHDGMSIVFDNADPELQKAAGLFCPGCGQWMDAETMDAESRRPN